jgi:phage portal protein BeeE
VTLLDRLIGRAPSPQRSYSLEMYIQDIQSSLYGQTLQQTLADGTTVQVAPDTFLGHASRYANNSVMFACIAVRLQTFSAARFTFQRLLNGRASELFGQQSLGLLERPWPGGTTQDLLTRILLDTDLAGNSYWIREGSTLVRLRPDWVDIVLRERASGVGWEKLGYAYWRDGNRGGADQMIPLRRQDVAHFAPNPDPIADFRGMSWMTPVVREMAADDLMTHHKRKFFENAATPNMVVSYPERMNADQVKKFAAVMYAEHEGSDNAYKTMHLGGGVDATVVGSDLKSIDFRAVQAAGETRIAAAAGVPPILVGLSEGLDSATYSNYGQARRRFADGTLHPLWSNVAGSLEMLVPAPDASSRLWYDARDIPFLREDSKDAAEIAQLQANTMRTLVDAGYTAESVSRAVMSGDFGLLVHSGLYSVQLQAAGANPGTPALTEGNDS